MKKLLLNHDPPGMDLPAARYDWSQSDLSRPLIDSEIHIWCASLEYAGDEVATLFSLLSSDEKARSERFYFERDRNRFIAGRGLLRVILSGYLGMDPFQIEFIYGGQGKPALKSRVKDKVLEFNLSHSRDLGLYIFSWNRKVGIDVEFNRPMTDYDNLAELFFTAGETALIKSLFDDQKQETFYKIWTGKESYLKAIGTGLASPLDQVGIALGTEGDVQLLAREGVKCEGWQLGLFHPQANYQGAFAIEGNDLRIKFQTLDRRDLF